MYANQTTVSSDQLLKECVEEDFNGDWQAFKSFLESQTVHLFFHTKTKCQIKLDLERVKELMRENNA